ncbi:MAG: hypothetical protein FH748_11910 [Balneolaceae bacterium]|nr:hypothetical protein [Balneolaceae bacterium]
MRGFFLYSKYLRNALTHFFHLLPKQSFDIILVGATGFTGQRAARYLHQHAPDSLRWGLAARNSSKLESIAGQLNISGDRLFTVDTLNRQQVDQLVQQSRIIITTVGPFSLYGEQLIASCSEHGTHYLDITGEVGFIRKMKEKYQQTAIENKCKLIPFSGFDSVPADIAAFLLSREFAKPDKLTIRAYYSIRGGFNGGTIATMMNKFESGEYKQMNNPALLITDASQQIEKDPLQNYFGFSSDINRWVTPFIMSPINSKVVYNTAAEMRKQGKPYAERMSYQEFSSLGKKYNPVSFFITALILLAITKLGPKKWFRTILQNIMPAPGEGPSEEAIENGYFKMRAIASDETGLTKQLTMSYPGDPGNKSTVFFLCESALCLALNPSLNDRYGFLSPVLAFEDALVDRMTQQQLSLSIS